MEITEIRIKLMDDSSDRLQAFCSITFDNCFVVRDLKIIDGTSGPFVAMPSRKLTSHCPKCHCKNYLRAAFCTHCGLELKEEETPKDSDGRAKLYADIAHPINSRCREMIQQRVIHEYHWELQSGKQPGYVTRYDDFYEDAGPCTRSEISLSSDEARSYERRIDGRLVKNTESDPPTPHSIRTGTPSSRTGSEQQDQFGAGIF